MLKPLNDRVVLKVVEEAEKTVGGFVLASASQEKPQVAEVVAVGPGKFSHGNRIEPAVAVGDRVVFEKFAGSEVKDGDETYLIVREKEILAIID
ncbi:co-chaperone GroES [Streptococcus merionis]|uniref:co-chaperone GroES n=1 Tax=Streptococcus merionis TaxID=400065 RepID=UPI0026EEF844|nr:co-chaperone GroES [Streptococcus merionis]